MRQAGHCCGNGATKAICGGQLRPGRKLAESIAVFTDNSGNNDFCLLVRDPFKFSPPPSPPGWGRVPTLRANLQVQTFRGARP